MSGNFFLNHIVLIVTIETGISFIFFFIIIIILIPNL